MRRIAIIVPVYNEEKYLPEFLGRLLKEVEKNPKISHILFINDGSTDGTKKIIQDAQKKHKNIILVNAKTNIGKGHAMRLGLEKAIKNNNDSIIFIDGDGQHDPSSLKTFIQELEKFPVVFGYRRLKKNAPMIRKIGNTISSFIIRNIFNINRKGDILCGYLAIRRDVYKEIEWHSHDYGVEAEISAIIGRKMIPFKEILVKTIYLDHKKGVHMLHALRILFRIPFWTRVHLHK